MDFKQGNIPWNKGKHGVKTSNRGQIPWNKGTKGVMKAWNKGKPHSEEHKKHLSENHYKQHTIETRMKMSEAHMGSKNHEWKGGAKQENLRLRQQLQYVLWRDAVLQMADYTCQTCGRRGGKLHAHHKQEFAKYPELRFCVQNGMCMCEECHRIYHGNPRKVSI